MKSRTPSLLKTLRTLGAIAAIVIATTASSHATNINSNGTGGGSWNSGSTWSGGVVPPNADLWSVLSTDSVTAGSGVNFNNTSAYACTVLGTLTINSGANFNLYRLNSGLSSGHGTINVNGGTLTTAGLLGSTGYTGTINISNGGFVSQTSTAIAGVYTFNINSGGVFSNQSGFFSGATVNLNSGGVLETPVGAASLPQVNATFNWNGGTFVLNTNSSYAINNSVLNGLMTAFQNNASNVLQLSNQSSKQTVTLGTGTSSGNISPTKGILAFNVYSPTANDNDLITESNTTGANAAITLPSAVHLQINNATLTGDFSSYIGASYKLFNTSSTYSTINPTIDPTYWTLNGVEYRVGWNNTLNSNGSVAVSSLVPPVGYGRGEHYSFGEDSNGFSIIPAGPTVSGTTTVPSAHQTIYVSSSGVDAAGNGTMASPVKTLGYAIGLVRKGSSDWILLKRGDTFTSPTGTLTTIAIGHGNNFGTATDPYYPQMIGSYDTVVPPTHPRPIVQLYNFIDWHGVVRNFVLEDINFDASGTSTVPQYAPIDFLGLASNVLIENCQFNYQVIIQGNPANGTYNSGITVRRCEFLSIANKNPLNGSYLTNAWGTDQPTIVNERVSGLFQYGTISFLYEDNIADHNGWADGYDSTGTMVGNPNEPPSQYSHNLYSSGYNADMTVRNNISTRAASMGFKLASDGNIYGNVMVDNNIGFGLAADPDGTSGCFLTVHDNVVADADDKFAQFISARGWGIYLASPPPTPNGEVIRNIETNSPAVNNTGTFTGTQALSTPIQQTWLGAHTSLSGTNVVYNFSQAGTSSPNLNQTGSSYYDSNRTIESYNASVGGTATLADFFAHIRAQEKANWNPAYTAQPIVRYMQVGFNLAPVTLRTGTMVTFTGAGQDQMRWDNRSNWSTNDIPGSIANDSVNINGKEVVYDGTYSLTQLELQNGGTLDIDKGSLSLTGSASILTVGTLGGTINVGYCGALNLVNYTTSNSPLTINQDGGLLTVRNNLGSGSSVKVNVYISGGTAILGSPGTGSHFGSGSSLNIIGAGANTIGYQTATGSNYLAFDSGGTLSYTFDTSSNGVTPIGEFVGSTVSSVLTINSGATLNIDMSGRTGLAAGNYTATLAQADTLTGTFSTVNIIAPPATKITSPTVVYSTGKITLTYTVTP